MADIGESGPRSVAQLYAFHGQADRAFDWLERAFQRNNLQGVKVDPYLASLHADPRFKALLRRLRVGGNSHAQ